MNYAVLEVSDKALAGLMALLRAFETWGKFPSIAAIGVVCLQQAHPGSTAAAAQGQAR